MNASAKWQPIRAGYYLDPVALRDAQIAQSSETVGGKVARFRIPIAECHNPPESPLRVRAWAAGQLERIATRQREVFADRFAEMKDDSDESV